MEAGFQLALDSAPFLLKGAYYTVILSLGGMFFGLLLGFGLALMRLSRFKLLSWTARVYVSFFRGTPLLVQLFLIYYGLPQVGIELDPIPAAMIGFSLNMAAYACEILRAAIKSLAALTNVALLAALAAVPAIKTGRPSTEEVAEQNKPVKKARNTKR